MRKEAQRLAQMLNERHYAVYVGRKSVGINGRPHVDLKTGIKQMKELIFVNDNIPQ